MIHIFLFVLGSVIGSFLNVLIDRIPNEEDIIWTPSHCDHCKKRLRWFELIPLVSYVISRGRCRRCKKKLSLQYPVIEFLTGIGFVLLFQLFFVSWPLLIALYAILAAAIAIFVIDLKHQIIPDSMLMFLLGIALVLGYFLPPGSRMTYLANGVAAGTFFFLLWIMTRSKGIGFGDVKLVSIIGLFLGHPKTVIALYAAFLTGAILSVILIISRRAGMKSRIAFGPFLIIGAGIAALWGDHIWRLWLTLV